MCIRWSLCRSVPFAFDCSQDEGVGFSAQLRNSEGAYVVHTLTSALWYIDSQYDTLEHTTKNEGSSVISPISDRWISSFHKERTYDDWKSKKLREPGMDQSGTAAHACALFAIVSKPCMASSKWMAL